MSVKKKKIKIPFSKWPIKKRRLAVLKDALKLFKTKALIATVGKVVDVSEFNTFWIEGKSQFQSILKKHFKKKKKCYVCQRGGLLCALVLRDNSFTFNQVEGSGTFTDDCGSINGGTTDKRLGSIWSTRTKQLALMETAYEGQYNREFLGRELFDRAIDFYIANRFFRPSDKQERSIAILENAIANGGLFKP